jgi:hypothetical protein
MSTVVALQHCLRQLQCHPVPLTVLCAATTDLYLYDLCISHSTALASSSSSAAAVVAIDALIVQFIHTTAAAAYTIEHAVTRLHYRYMLNSLPALVQCDHQL